MIETPPFNDGRGRYPDRIAAAAPRGFRECVKRAAQAERISLGEFVRRAIAEHISANERTLLMRDDGLQRLVKTGGMQTPTRLQWPAMACWACTYLAAS